MEHFCQFCGSEIMLNRPTDVDHKYEADYNRIRHSKSKWLIYDKEGLIIGEWIGKDAINSWYGLCDCDKRVFHIEEHQLKTQIKIPAFRSIIETKKLLEVYINGLQLFECGKHWYNFSMPKTLPPNIKTFNQLELFI